ncbi:MAG TPA: hypothetical protein VFW76_09875 [Ktedonobacterales bacterium]|nr:hypothetical protein [Ktedonobacterales bacterium]
MLTLIHRTRREDRVATEDRVILADGSVFVVPRANLTAAKALLAAEKAAQRRADARRASARQNTANRLLVLGEFFG